MQTLTHRYHAHRLQEHVLEKLIAFDVICILLYAVIFHILLSFTKDAQSTRMFPTMLYLMKEFVVGSS